MNTPLFATLGRMVLGLFFFAAGSGKIFGAAPPEQLSAMTNAGIPEAGVMFMLAGVGETVGGICMVLGLHTKLVAALLAAFCVIVSVLLHAFWTFPQGHEQIVQMIMFMKNIATAAGLLAFVGFGSGPLALDRAFGHNQ